MRINLYTAACIARTILAMLIGMVKGWVYKHFLSSKGAPMSPHYLQIAAFRGNTIGTTVHEQREMWRLTAGHVVVNARKLAPKVRISREMDGTSFVGTADGQIASETTSPGVVVLYVHGGGFVGINAASFSPTLALVVEGVRAQGLSCQLLSLEYDLAPEHPFPHALAQVIAKIQELKGIWPSPAVNGMRHLGPPPATILMGDSAGANLLLASMLALHQLFPDSIRSTHSPVPPLAGALLLAPWVDISPGQSTYLPMGGFDWVPWLQGAFGMTSYTLQAGHKACVWHVHPCTNHSTPADSCECVAKQRHRLNSDFVTAQYLSAAVQMYMSTLPAQLKGLAHQPPDSSNKPSQPATSRTKPQQPSNLSNKPPLDTSNKPSKHAASSTEPKQPSDSSSKPTQDSSIHSMLLTHIKATLLRHIKSSGLPITDVNALSYHPLLSPGLADGKVLSATLASLLNHPALVMAGELEAFLPDIQQMVDNVNQAASEPGIQQAVDLVHQAASNTDGRQGDSITKESKRHDSGMLAMEVWPADVHDAVLLPGREALIPRLSQYICDATRAWQAVQ